MQYAGQFHVHAGPSTYWMDLNTQVPPFNNPDVRKAVNFAMDRNAIVKAYGGPQARCHHLSGGTAWVQRVRAVLPVHRQSCG